MQRGSRGKESHGGKEGGSSEKRQEQKEVLSADLMWKESTSEGRSGGALIGKLITERNLNRMVTCQMIRKGWNMEKNEELEITEVERNAFIFGFRRIEDKLRILRGRPWSIQGILLSIQPWKEYETFSEINFYQCPFWIQFHDLPTGAMYEENAIALGSKIGEVMIAENPRRNELLIRSFLRTRAIVDIRKPLVTGMWCPRPERDPIWVKARYERLQNFCYKCGRIGHDQKCCSDEEGEEHVEEGRYGAWLSVLAARPMDEIMKYCKDGWEEEIEVRKNKDRYEKSKSNATKGKVAARNLETTIECNEGCRKGAGKKEGVEEWEKELKAKMRNEEEKDKEVAEEVKEMPVKVHENKTTELVLENSSENEEDLTKEIVIYETQPLMAEVVSGLKRMQLKREREDEEEREAGKRRRLEYNGDSAKREGTAAQGLGKVRRKYVRGKKQIKRNETKRERMPVKDRVQGSKEGPVKYVTTERQEDQILKQAEIVAEGYGGWPITATKER